MPASKWVAPEPALAALVPWIATSCPESLECDCFSISLSLGDSKQQHNCIICWACSLRSSLRSSRSLAPAGPRAWGPGWHVRGLQPPCPWLAARIAASSHPPAKAPAGNPLPATRLAGSPPPARRLAGSPRQVGSAHPSPRGRLPGPQAKPRRLQQPLERLLHPRHGSLPPRRPSRGQQLHLPPHPALSQPRLGRLSRLA